MNFKRWGFFLSMFFLCVPSVVHAAHLLGGSISYKYLGANRYAYSLVIYRDCASTTLLDQQAYVSVFINLGSQSSPNYGWQNYTAVSLTSSSVLPVVFPTPCLLPTYSVCIEVGYYQDTIILPPNPGGYVISYDRCCRNASINNIANPGLVGMVITTTIPGQTNNSPKFINVPPIYACISDTFDYSFACTDLDGDSLSYQLDDPLYGIGNTSTPAPWAQPPPYQQVIWGPGYSANQPVPSTGPLLFNTGTGKFKFKPNTIGQFVIGIKVLEYRNGILINTNRLDFELNVLDCKLVASIPLAPNVCQGLTVTFPNASINASEFLWNFGDPGTLTDTSSQTFPTYTYPAYGTYTISLIAKKGNCPDTATKVINVYPLLSPTIQSNYAACFKNNNITFSVGGAYDPSATFNWSFTPSGNIVNSGSNPVQIHFNSATNKTVSVLVSHFGCSELVKAVVSFSNPVAGVDQSTINCIGKQVNLFNQSTDAVLFKWDFGITNLSSDTSHLTNPSFLYPSYGVYTITLIASDGNCRDTLKFPIKVFPLLSLSPLPAQNSQCFRGNAFSFSVSGSYGNGAQFLWTFTNGKDTLNSNEELPKNIHFPVPGIYSISLVVAENGCQTKRIQYLEVFEDPKAKYTLNKFKPCDSANVIFTVVMEPQHQVNAFWTINKEHFSKPVVTYPFHATGTYTFSLIVRDNHQCSDTLKDPGKITIYKSPLAGIHVNPKYTSILDPKIVFVDTSNGEYSTLLKFGDGTFSTERIILHHYAAPGVFIYSLTVSDKNGCDDTLSGEITIDDIDEGFIPNIFTPNNDGINDVFFVTGNNITSGRMFIYDRWGNLVFESVDVKTGWSGVNKNSKIQSSEGTYYYLIEITLGQNRIYKFHGDLTLQR